jgi:phosphoserine phosphatase
MLKSPQEDIVKELTDLRRRLSELRNSVEDYYNKALEWKAKRDDLNKSMHQLVAKLKDEREQRKQANEKVAEQKELKQEFNRELEEKTTRMDELELKKRESLTSIKDDPEYVRQRIRKLEWFLQTNVLSLSRENELVKEISSLEKRIQGAKAVDEIENQLAQVSGQARNIDSKVREHRKLMLGHVRDSQGHHAAVIELGKKVAEMKNEADSAHEKYLDFFGLASQSLSESKRIQDRIGELVNKIELERESKRPDKNRDLKERTEKVAAQAFDKVKKGSRITMDELSVLVEKGYFSDGQKPP